MKRKLSQKSFEELTFLKDWNLTIVEFMKSKCKNKQVTDMYCQVINHTFSNSNLSGMRTVYRDITEMTRGFSKVELDEINQILKEKFDTDLTKQKTLMQIKKIVKRGYLKNEDEFRLLSNRVDEIYEDDSKKDEVEILNQLLGDYETH